MRDGHVLQMASPKELYERPTSRFVADFVGTNNFLAGVVRERTGEWLAVETSAGTACAGGRRSESTPAIGACSPCARRTSAWARPTRPRCACAGRPENVDPGRAQGNILAGRIVLASYLGNTLRYDVEVAGGTILKVDVRDPWHHDLLPAGHEVKVTFPASAALTLPDA